MKTTLFRVAKPEQSEEKLEVSQDAEIKDYHKGE